MAALPENAGLMNWRMLDTGPGDVLMPCSASTASFVQRDRNGQGADWQGSPPDLVRFSWYPNQADPAREDHAAVAIWELSPPIAI